MKRTTRIVFAAILLGSMGACANTCSKSEDTPKGPAPVQTGVAGRAEKSGGRQPLFLNAQDGG
ncbi:MAG: hypothetical protein JNL38_17080 [Myxococcales bacterium]|jgi:hypothetical protein|nr:hypothetical protein [Myxococcales bacterium]